MRTLRRMKKTGRVLFGSLAAVAALVTSALPAQAADVKSDLLGGYGRAQTVTSVSTSWVVPTVACNASGTQRLGEFIWLKGASVPGWFTAVISSCGSGRVTHQVMFHLGSSPTLIQSPVMTGDKINASIQKVGTSWKLTMQNATRGWTASKTTPFKPQSEYFVGINEPQEAVIPKLTKPVPFTNTLVNGQPLKAAAPNRIILQEGTKVKALPSAIGADGKSFTVTWKAS